MDVNKQLRFLLVYYLRDEGNIYYNSISYSEHRDGSFTDYLKDKKINILQEYYPQEKTKDNDELLELYDEYFEDTLIPI